MEEYPPKVSLNKDVYRPFPTLPENLPASSNIDDPASLVNEALTSLSVALGGGDVGRVRACFLTQQSYWRDILAFTWHLRTFCDRGSIAPALVELASVRCSDQEFRFELDPKSVHEVHPKPDLKWIEGMFTFETKSPAARCGGRVVLFPEASEEGFEWKIWTLSTWVDDLVASPQDVGVLQAPKRRLEDEGDTFETDVFIIGGGNA